jgi:YVTN family beta-propeller protein
MPRLPRLMAFAKDSLRRAGIVTAIVAAFACFAAASASAAPLVWTVNANEESVSTINSGTNLEVGSSIEVGNGPKSIAISPNGRRALVTNYFGESVTVIETATRKPVGTMIPLVGRPIQVAIAPDGKTAYVIVENDEHVFPIDVETAKLGDSVGVGAFTSAVAVNPTGTRAYVGVAPEEIQQVETGTGKVVGSPIEIGGLPTAIVFSPDGKTAYVVAEGLSGIVVVNTALAQAVREIPLTDEPTSIALSPDGRRLYATSEAVGTVTVVETATSQTAGSPIVVGGTPTEIALTPDGRTAYVAGGEIVTPIDLGSRVVGTPIATTGAGVEHLVVAPDQSPTAAFVPPAATTTLPATFDGSASTDPDGTIASWEWAFGDGTIVQRGTSVTHTYKLPGTYNARLSVVDNEGCGSEEVFTGRTAYCSGGASAIGHPVVAAEAPAAPVLPAVCKSKFSFGALVHNRKNGTARLQVKLPAAGSLLLFGKKVHAVTRKTKVKGSMFLTIHARVELNKRLKKIHRTSVRVRVTFTPASGCGFKTVHRSLSLLRAPKKHHH